MINKNFKSAWLLKIKRERQKNGAYKDTWIKEKEIQVSLFKNRKEESLIENIKNDISFGTAYTWERNIKPYENAILFDDNIFLITDAYDNLRYNVLTWKKINTSYGGE